MKTLTITLLLALSILSLSFIPQQPKQWEYKFVYQCDEKKANNTAAEGWELVNLSMAAYGSIGVGTCAFKRAK